MYHSKLFSVTRDTNLYFSSFQAEAMIFLSLMYQGKQNNVLLGLVIHGELSLIEI